MHRWALDKNLTFMGNSDIHAPSTLQESTVEQHRPMTLVFAHGKSIPAVKDALESGRTAIWFEDKIIGRQKYLEALFEAAVRITDIEREGKVVRFTLRNGSDLSLNLQRVGRTGPREVVLPPDAVMRIRLNAGAADKPVEMSYTVENFLMAPGRGLPVSFTIAGDVEAEISSP